MKSDLGNVGSQAIISDIDMNHCRNDTYAVKTMRFDDILPVLKEKNIRDAVMKSDVQWSETYLCQIGSETFDSVNISVVLMKWDIGAHLEDRIRNVFNFFTKRGYVATANMCQVLNETEALRWWPSDVYWMKMKTRKISAVIHISLS